MTTKRHDHMAFTWLSLPADIRLFILDEVSGQKHRGWAQCPAVCKEWQAILEPKNFSQLALEPSCLDDLETLVIRQRPLVQHICLKSIFLSTPVALVNETTPCPLVGLPFSGRLL